MAKNRRLAEELTIAELEALLARKKMEARQVRLKQFQRSGRVLPVPTPHATLDPASANQANSVLADEEETPSQPKQPLKRFLNRALVVVEVAAAVGFLYVLLSGAGALKRLNAEVAEALSLGEPVPTPLITAVVLPSGHTPPTSPGGAQPNEAAVAALRCHTDPGTATSAQYIHSQDLERYGPCSSGGWVGPAAEGGRTIHR